jgi:hypothetical protein
MLSMFSRHRLMLFYKGDISALTLFAQQLNGSVCFPAPLPKLSVALDANESRVNAINMHPATLVNAINQHMHLDSDLLRAEPGFCEQVDAPGGIITVYLARFILLDPPHALMAEHECKMKTLPELRGRPPAEMELLRRAYTLLMEG